jgi:flagellar assembly protein FliH
MSLSDSTMGADSEWKPLHPYQITDSVTGPVGDEEDGEFKLLYEPSEIQNDTFDPLHEKSLNPFRNFNEKDRPNVTSPNSKSDRESDGELESDTEKIRKQTYEEGFAAGEKKGIADGKKEVDGTIQRLQTLLMEMEEIWKHLIGTHEQQIVQLICRAAEKVVFGQIAIDPDVIKRAILHAFQMIPEPVEVTIELNSDDTVYIETLKEDFFKQLKSLKHISVVPTPSITQGGCRVKTRFGEVDATVESRIGAIQQTIMNVFRNKVTDGPHPSSDEA